jgi:hypothetical protein
MLTREQECQKALQSLLATMQARSEDADKIQILSDALNEGLRIEPEDARALVGVSSAAVIEFFLNHESCTVQHLVKIFNACSYENNKDTLSILTACMMHPKFPGHRKEYVALGGKSLVKIYIELINQHGGKEGAGFAFIKTIFKNHQKLVSYSSLFYFFQEMNTRYVDDAELEEVLWLICQHPGYWYVSESKVSDVSICDIDKNFLDRSSPFHHATFRGFKDVFNYHYFHKNILDGYKVAAVRVLSKRIDCMKSGRDRQALGKISTDLMIDVADHWFKSNYEKHMFTFYLVMMYGENPLLLLRTKDVVFAIIKMWIESAAVEFCVAAIKEGSFKPAIYKSNPMVMFQRPPIPHDLLIMRVGSAIDSYLSHQDRPTEKGGRRAMSLSILLGNSQISSECKFLAIYSVLNEAIPFGQTSRIKNHLLAAIGDYLELIKTAAADYAKEKNFNLEKLMQNLVSVFLQIGGENMGGITEDKLIEKIGKGAEIKVSNGKRFW